MSRFTESVGGLSNWKFPLIATAVWAVIFFALYLSH
jgi:hypothetical protein